MRFGWRGRGRRRGREDKRGGGVKWVCDMAPEHVLIYLILTRLMIYEPDVSKSS